MKEQSSALDILDGFAAIAKARKAEKRFRRADVLRVAEEMQRAGSPQDQELCSSDELVATLLPHALAMRERGWSFEQITDFVQRRGLPLTGPLGEGGAAFEYAYYTQRAQQAVQDARASGHPVRIPPDLLDNYMAAYFVGQAAHEADLDVVAEGPHADVMTIAKRAAESREKKNS